MALPPFDLASPGGRAFAGGEELESYKASVPPSQHKLSWTSSQGRFAARLRSQGLGVRPAQADSATFPPAQTPGASKKIRRSAESAAGELAAWKTPGRCSAIGLVRGHVVTQCGGWCPD